MGLFSVFEKIINIENINLGCKKTREEDCIKKLNAIFSIVAEYSLSTKLNEVLLPPNIVKIFQIIIFHKVLLILSIKTLKKKYIMNIFYKLIIINILHNKSFNNTATALALTTTISTNCILTSKATNKLKSVMCKLLK